LSRYIATPKFQSHIERIQAGGTRQALNFSQISGFDIPLPPIEEQRRIARILDTADALRLKRRLALQKLDSLTQSIFLEMFGDPAANAMDWNIAQLGDVCDVRDGTHESPKYVDQGFPLVTSKNLTSGKVDLSDVQLISEKDFEAINRRSKVDEGDILMPMIGTIGSPVIVGKNPRFAIKNVALIKFKSDSPRNCFVHAFLSSDHFNRHVKSGNRGGTQKFLSLGDIRRIPVPIPPSALQVKFDEAMSKLDEVRARFHLNDSMLERTWASIQHRAFRGEL
jgi:type I restriction enzyme S subunit